MTESTWKIETFWLLNYDLTREIYNNHITTTFWDKIYANTSGIYMIESHETLPIAEGFSCDITIGPGLFRDRS